MHFSSDQKFEVSVDMISHDLDDHDSDDVNYMTKKSFTQTVAKYCRNDAEVLRTSSHLFL